MVESIRGIGLRFDTDRMVELIEDDPVFGVRHQRDRQVTPRDVRSVAGVGETVVPWSRLWVDELAGWKWFLTTFEHRPRVKFEHSVAARCRLVEPGMPAEHHRLANVGARRNPHRESVVIDRKVLLHSTSEWPRIRELQRDRGVFGAAPRRGKPEAMHGVGSEVFRHGIGRTVERESTVTDSPGEGNHWITAPHDRVVVAWNEQLNAIDDERRESTASFDIHDRRRGVAGQRQQFVVHLGLNVLHGIGWRAGHQTGSSVWGDLR